MFNNNLRTFDPTYTSSPFYGQIVPKRKLRISVDGFYQFIGIIDDWNLSYSPSGESLAEAIASDAFVTLANTTLTTGLTTAQLSGARVTAILDDPLVSFPAEDRSIDTGNTFLGQDSIAEDTTALSYLQLVEESEAGNLFIGRDGKLVFRARNSSLVNSGKTFADDGTGIRYKSVDVTYGSELLYNEINATTIITNDTITVTSAESQSAYGILSYNSSGLLINSLTDLNSYANYLLGKYDNPEYRFEAMEFELLRLNDTDFDNMITLELGDTVIVKFTPNGITPAIQQYGTIVRIEQSITMDSHTMVVGLSTSSPIPLILDSSAFGILDVNSLAW